MKIKIALSAIAVGTSIWLVAMPELKLHAALQKTDSPNPEHPSIIMLGDSHTEFVNWRALVNCESIANSGVGGNTTAQMLARLPAVISASPRLVFLMAGTNDALQHIEPKVSRANIRAIEMGLISKDISVVVLAPPPLPSDRSAIAAISEVATIALPLSDSDLLEDHVHLRRSAYAKWRDVITPFVNKFCQHAS